MPPTVVGPLSIVFLLSVGHAAAVSPCRRRKAQALHASVTARTLRVGGAVKCRWWIQGLAGTPASVPRPSSLMTALTSDRQAVGSIQVPRCSRTN